MRSFVIAATGGVVGGVAAVAAPAHAFASFLDDVPNGSFNRCTTCHVSAGGGNPWNDFGKDILRQDPDVTEADLAATAAQNRNYSEVPSWDAGLCGADSDADGQSNGQELGDPGCVWVTGAQPPRTTAVSNPASAASLSSDPDGLDPAAGEGEGAAAAEGEGEGGLPPGCPGCTSTGDAAFPLAGLVVSLSLSSKRLRRIASC